MLDKIEQLSPIQYAIIKELCTAVDILKGGSGLLAILGSWGDTLPESEILSMLKEWNVQVLADLNIN